MLVTEKTIDHIINREDDKTRYKSINKMFATLERPTLINESENGGKYYCKIFKTKGETKNQTVVVRINENGEVVETTYPTKRDNNFFNNLKKGKTIYNVKNKRRKGDNNIAPVNNSITDNAGNFNPSIKNNEEYHQDEPEQQSIFEGNNKARGFRKYKGAYMPAENIIEFFKGADESTIVHEFAHWYLNALVEDAKYHEGSKLDLDAVRKFVRNNGEPFTREQHEKFARGFEAYVRSGWAKTNRLKKR